MAFSLSIYPWVYKAQFGQGGTFLFGKFSIADAMYAPVCTRFKTYDVKLDPVSGAYRDAILAWSALQQWTKEALDEPEEMEELDVEF